MPGLQAGRIGPQLPNQKNQPFKILKKIRSIKLPMHPQADRGAESSESFKHIFCYKNKEITVNVEGKMQKRLKKTDNQDQSSKIHSATSFKTAEISAHELIFDCLVPSRSANNQPKINNYCLVNKCKINCKSILNQLHLNDKIHYFLFSRYKFSVNVERRTVESCPGVAGIKGYRVSTLGRAGHGIRSAHVYATFNSSAIYNSTVRCRENVSYKNLSDTNCLHFRKVVVNVGMVLGAYFNWILDMYFINFRIYYLHGISELSRVKDRSVHLWVSTGFFTLGR